jgi:hypothetical protein
VSAVLRAFGPDFDVDAFLRESAYEGANAYHRGDPIFFSKPEGRKRDESGITILVSEAGLGDFPSQVNDAIEFFRRHDAEIIRMVKYPGVMSVVIDFGVEWGRSFTHSDLLPAALVILAGGSGVAIQVSHYPVSDDTSWAKANPALP